ncbi:MAG: hypothetical protein EOM51_07440 [Clostridia bacterium]|nr:hypothetical protein [Clostridia bacterium]
MKETSEICKAFVPPEIIKHLWTITELYDEDRYVFVLSSRRLGDSMVQDIKIIVGDRSYLHSVYGFKPVDFTIKVSSKDKNYRMTLIPSSKAEYEIEKWRRRNLYNNFLKKLSSSPEHFRVRRAW